MDNRASESGSDSGWKQSPPVADLPRARAVLRLLFDDQAADRLATRFPQDDNRLIRASVRRWTIERWLGRVTRRASEPTATPLSPHTGTSAIGAVGLAFQLGLGTSVEQITDATGTSVEQIGESLYAVRQRLTMGDLAACREFTSAVGRYRDPSLDIAQRAAMLHHAQRCASCRTALERIQSVDAHLIEQVDRSALGMDATVNADRSQIGRSRTLPWAAGIAVFVLLAVVGAGILRSHLRSSPATQSVANQPTTALSGWLLSETSNGQVAALNLASGFRQVVGPPETQAPDPYTGDTQIFVSPDGRLIARQEPVSQPTPHFVLTVFALDGSLNRTVDLQGQDRYILSGWLDNGTVLEVTQPSQDQNEPLDRYVVGLQTDSTVVALNIASAAQHQMFRGSVQAIYPSPDRSMVVMSTWDNAQNNPSIFELRPIENGAIGDAITSTAVALDREPIWAPDSSLVYITPVLDQSGTPTVVADQAGISDVSTSRREPTASLDRTGHMTLLRLLPEGVFSYPIAVSPDGQFLVSATGSYNTAAGSSRYQIWRTTINGDDPVPLAGSSPNPMQSGIWSPSGGILMLQYIRPFLIGPSGDNIIQGTVWSSSTLAVFPDGRTVTVRTQLDTTTSSSYFGWLPVDALPDPTTAASGGHPGSVTAVDQLSQGRLETDPSSQASLGGQYVTLSDATDDSEVIWDRGAGTGRRLGQGKSALSWIPQADQLIGVGNLDAGQSDGISRLMTFAPAFGGSVPEYDYRAYDPAGFGTSTALTYANPTFSPNENTLAFFTIDKQGAVSLWLVSYDLPAKLVYRWTVPTDSKVDANPIATWVDNSALVVAEPADWHDGLPGRFLLHRLTIDSQGTPLLETLTTLEPRGNERGVNLEELTLSSRSGRIAYRLRHFTQSSATDGAFDSVDIITLDHPGDPIEVSRQGIGNGLSWSPDGTVLATPVSGQIRFYSSIGDLLGTVTGLENQSSPVWVSSSEVWFDADVDGRTRVMSVEVY